MVNGRSVLQCTPEVVTIATRLSFSGGPLIKGLESNSGHGKLRSSSCSLSLSFSSLTIPYPPVSRVLPGLTNVPSLGFSVGTRSITSCTVVKSSD